QSVAEGSEITLPYDLEIRGGTLTIDRKVHLSGGTMYNTNHIGVLVTADGVSLKHMTIIGSGNDQPYRARTPGISVQGDPDRYLTTHIEGCTILDQVDGGIRVEFVRDFTITRNTIERYRYGGIMVNSGINGTVSENLTRDANQPGNNS